MVPKEILDKLVTRTCKCGCGKVFKVFPESSQEYYSSFHSPSFKLKYSWRRIMKVSYKNRMSNKVNKMLIDDEIERIMGDYIA